MAEDLADNAHPENPPINPDATRIAIASQTGITDCGFVRSGLTVEVFGSMDTW